MNPYPTVDHEFGSIQPKDLWVYNKLQLSRQLNYLCGPAGTSVPREDFYIVRPSINFMGMGRMAFFEKLFDRTSHLHPGTFWCEIFEGPHYSVDYLNTSQVLCVEGISKDSETLSTWEKWVKIDKTIEFPEILDSVSGRYPYINCEFIGDKLIEVHFRHNPNFRHGNRIAIPVYDENELLEIQSNQQYIYDPDYFRLGFIIE